MMKKLTKLWQVLALCLILPISSSYGQAVLCGTSHVQAAAKQQDPKLAKRLNDAELDLRAYLNSTPRAAGVVYTIPVVVHVINNGEQLGNGQTLVMQDLVAT